MDKQKIKELLVDHNAQHVDKYAGYCQLLTTEKNKKTGQLKNAWSLKIPDEKFAEMFRRVNNEGLVLDGEHITIGWNGLSYDYIAYKNKMFVSYPETTIDVQLVREDDVFSFSKESGTVKYSHSITNPFLPKNVIGGYCIIKNKRGEFITILDRKEIDKHRKVAKTDYIWSQWFNEMALKTVIKKACKQHFADVYQEIDTMDNENYDLNNPLDIQLKYKQDIDALKTHDECKQYMQSHKGLGKDVDKYLLIRNKQINENT